MDTPNAYTVHLYLCGSLILTNEIDSSYPLKKINTKSCHNGRVKFGKYKLHVPHLLLQNSQQVDRLAYKNTYTRID